MTKTEALAIPVSTDEFDAAVELMADVCEANPKDKEAAAVLMVLLERNDEACRKALYAYA
jgi:hypothetical protein